MIVKCTISRYCQVEILVLHVGTKSEIYFWKSTSENHLVISIDFAIRRSFWSAYILVEAVADVGALLCGMVVKISLCACDAFINPTIEFANFLTYISGISSCDI